ncbi:DUF4347 domain-containing protein, partial [Zobellella aerophila]|uniref:DUF4347 domain-containing protein n=1 Tax=Zobellella aerophila TaxID=870480 RepID=UPI0031EB3ED4
MNKQDNAKTSPGFRRKPLITALESRILLDGAAVATTVDMSTDVAFQQDPVHQPSPDQAVHVGDGALALAPTQLKAGDPGQNNGRKEVAFVDSGVTDYQILVDGIGAGIEVRLIDGGRDGLAQLAVWAQQNSGYDAIHILSHGAEGQLRLGTLTLDRAQAESRASELGALGQALNTDGDLLLYGCEVADGEGQAFVERLAELTGADVAASDDPTGAAALGGDWELEVTRGAIETAGEGISADAMAAFHHILAETVIENSATGITTSLGGDVFGQSFTAIQDGQLTKIGVANDLTGVSLSGTATLKVYAGAGTGGTLLYEKTGIDLRSVDTVNSLNDYSFYDITIDSNVQLTSGQVYSFVLTPKEAYSLVYTSEGYSEGDVYYNGSFVSGFDLAFRVTLDTTPANSTPSVSVANTSLAYTEGNAATQIDGAATLSDSDGDAEWNGGSLSVQITGNAEAGDRLSIVDSDGDGTTITISGTNIFANGVDIGDLSASGGIVTGGTKLTVTFDADATNANVQEVLQSMRFDSTANDPGTSNRTITFTATDKNAASGSDSRTIALTAVNDEPTLTANAGNPTFTEGGAAASLFTGTNINTVEAGQTITGLSFTITNVTNGSNERINVDGTTVVLTHGTNGSTAGNSLNYSVMVIGTTATVTMTGGNLSVAAAETMIDNMSYQNNSNAPSTSNRVVTLTSIQDSGGTANGGDNTASLAVASTVTVVQNNDEPTLTANGSHPTF